MIEKKCKRCGEKKRLGAFGLNKTFPDGKQIYCKICMSFFRKRYYDTPRSKLLNLERNRIYKRKNKDKIRIYKKQYLEKNRERLKCIKNTECVMIIENTAKNNINRIRKHRKKIDMPIIDIVINPKRIEE